MRLQNARGVQGTKNFKVWLISRVEVLIRNILQLPKIEVVFRATCLQVIASSRKTHCSNNNFVERVTETGTNF